MAEKDKQKERNQDHKKHDHHEHHDDQERHTGHEEHGHHEDHEGHGGGHDHHDHDHGDMVADFKKRFYISLLLTVPILILSPMIQSFLGVDWRFPFDQWILFGLSTIVFFYGGWPFLTGGISELKQKNPGMMTLIGLAIFVAYGYSSLVVFGWSGKNFFWELATLIDIMLLGHWIEMRSIMGGCLSHEPSPNSF